MKNVLVGVLTLTMLLAFAGTATAAWQEPRDYSWWAESGATPDPVRDAARPGYWWWPKAPASSSSDDLWGNRGVVFHDWAPAQPPAPAPEPAPAPPPAPAAPVAERTVPVFNHVLFAFDKSTLSSGGVSEVAGVADLLKENSSDTVTIEGHTCDINRSGDPEYNTKLGQRRADAVRAVLLEHGIDASRVSATSYGEDRPAVPNTSDSNRALNRRVVFLYSISD